MASILERVVYLYCVACETWRYFEIIGHADDDVAIIRCHGCGQTHLHEGR